MSIVKNSTVAKIAALAVALAFVFSFAGVTPAHAALTEAQIQSILSLLVSFGTDQATIDNVDASLRGQPTSGTGTGTSGSSVCPYVWGNNLSQGSTGADVLNLQKFLNDQGSTVASSGVGSPGNETSFYGSLTGAAVVKYQEANSASILAPVGLTSGVPFFGPSTRAHANANCTGTGTGTGTGSTPTAPVGTGLSVTSGVQPANTLAPYDAARVPFTNFTVTAGSDGDVVMNSVVVERTGLAVDANLASVVLLDSEGKQIGLTKTLNSNHQAKVGVAVTIPAGQSRTFSIGGNMANTSTVKSGEILSLDVVSINTSATVSGSLPIKGAQHTVNSTLAIGTITVQRGPLDPNNAITKEVGVTGYTFSALKITAGSNEKVRLHSVRWNQGSSSGASDLGNIMTIVEGVEYAATVSTDGKFYTSVFPGGILIDKGFSKEISIKADIVSGSGRTIAFTIEKNTDIDIRGELYGYGITPPTSGTGISTGNIWFAASTVTVSGGSMVVTQDTTVASQNIGLNVTGQTLAGFKVKVEGEAISVAKILFDVGTSSTGKGRVTDATIVDENGSVVAGPVDLPATANNNASLTFTDTITFPVGTGTYTIKGKIASEAANDSTYQLTTNPAADWTTVTGENTGDTLTPSPSGDQALQTMTVKASSVTISVSNSPAAQNVVAGAQGFTFANYQFDATASGEDVKFSNIPLAYAATNSPTFLTSCELHDGSTSLTSGTNSLDPTAAASSTTLTFDSPFIVAKGTVKTLTMKCNISSSAVTGVEYTWGFDSGSSPNGTGLVSGQSATITKNDSYGQVMTIAGSGTLTITKDSSSPSYALAAAGTTGNTMGVLKFRAANEGVNLTKIALQLTGSTTPPEVTANASTSASDVVQVSLWDGSTQIGTAIFTGSSFFATSTLTQTVLVPKDEDKLITIKVDFAGIGTSLPGTQGHLVKVDYDGADTTGTRGVGAGSGSTVNQGSSGDTAMAGIRIFKSIPTIAKLSVPTNTLSNGEKTLLRWSVTADSAGSIGISKFTLRMSSTTATVNSTNIYCYTDSGFSSVCSGVSTDGGLLQTDFDNAGLVDNQDMDISVQDSAGASTTLQVASGTTRYFEVRGTVSGAASGASISTQLQGDAAYVAYADGTFLGTHDTVNADTDNDLIWSANRTTDSAVTDVDWQNGFGIVGLPAANISAEVLSL